MDEVPGASMVTRVHRLLLREKRQSVLRDRKADAINTPFDRDADIEFILNFPWFIIADRYSAGDTPHYTFIPHLGTRPCRLLRAYGHCERNIQTHVLVSTLVTRFCTLGKHTSR